MTRLRRAELAMHLVTAFAFAVLAAASATSGLWFPTAVYGMLAAGWAGVWVFAMKSSEARLRYFVVSWLADHPEQRVYSLDLARDLGLGNMSAPLFPVLWQLELDGLVTSGWDPLEPGQRFRRRWYASAEADR